MLLLFAILKQTLHNRKQGDVILQAKPYRNGRCRRIGLLTMTFTSTNPVFSKVFVSSDPNAVANTTAQFKRLNVDEKLALLWYLYTEMGRTVTPAAPGAARMQFAEGLLNDIKQMSSQDQLKAMRDIVASVNTPVSRAYGVLTTNTKLAFWYQLAEWMNEGTVVPMPENYSLSNLAQEVFSTIKLLDFSQQITVLRNAVVDMGIDPLA